MKKRTLSIVVSILVGLFFINCNKKNPTSANNQKSYNITIYPGVSAVGIKLGKDLSSLRTYLNTNGTPNSDIVFYSSGFPDKRYIYYDSLMINVDGHNNQVIAAFKNFENTINVPGWVDDEVLSIVVGKKSYGCTDRKITIGDDLSEVSKVYGAPDDTSNTGSYIYSKIGITFSKTANNKVYSIVVYKPVN
jgi:hypothetical protein